jgi:glucose/arabinose dehydrogenase
LRVRPELDKASNHLQSTREASHSLISNLFLLSVLLLAACARLPTTPPPPTPTHLVLSPTSAPLPTPTPAPLLALQAIVTNTLDQPLGLANVSDGSGRLFVLEKRGLVRILSHDQLLPAPFLDIHERVSIRWERGLLGLAFEPGRPERFYINYTNRQGNNVIARYHLSPDPNLADPASEEILLTVQQPEANHNGGQLAFGPDGYLWIGIGDGGKANDFYQQGQNPHTLLATLLRIDVRGERGYRIPTTNPYDGEDGAPAVWAIGLRNPWRFSFDRATGDLWLADVGQYQWEEINHVPSTAAGLNYGWPIQEATHCFKTDPCQQTDLVQPIAEYSHQEGCAITGGYVYRGQAIPALQGHYLFGDFCRGRLWTIPADSRPGTIPKLMLETKLPITSFGEDETGELYLTSYDGGLYRIVASTNPDSP